jgi:glycosyltransferase 2 family protein
MMSVWKRVLTISLIALGVFFIVRFGLRFPWDETWEALMKTDLIILSAAIGVNLTSLLAKGWAWHLLLKPLARNRWGSAQTANWIGATVNCLSVSVAGEAARIQQIVRRDNVPVPAAVVSVVAERVIEGIGLSLFLLLTAGFIPLPHSLAGFRLGAAVVLASFISLALFYRPQRPPERLPAFIRQGLSSLAQIGRLRVIIGPILLSLFNWLTQWTTFHLVLLAAGSHPTLASSLVALLATNLAGFLRLTPSNVGIFQASMVISLAPLGFTAAEALSASLVLQAIQAIPVIVIGLWLIGRQGMIKTIRESRTRGVEVGIRG